MHQQWIWDGRPLDGARVLVRCYHALGDTIQFIRYAPALRRVAREVIVWAQPSLMPLLQSARGIDRLLPLHDGAPECEFDVDVEIMELPYVFRTTLATIPRDVPYLYAAPLATAAPLRPDATRVGIFWRVGDWDDRRAVPYDFVEPIAGLDGVEACMLPRTPPGALGIPTWTLLHAEPDWRWMMGRDDSPWYPTMRLFRQDRPGDWRGVIDRVTAVLRRVRASVA